MSSFFFTDTATTDIYTLSLHDALPIYPSKVERSGSDILQFDEFEIRSIERRVDGQFRGRGVGWMIVDLGERHGRRRRGRAEEHTSELQSQSNLVCRLLLEKKKK